MIDGKVCNVLTNQKSSSCCNICGVGPKYINDLSYVRNLKCHDNYYDFGMSTLHARIRSTLFPTRVPIIMAPAHWTQNACRAAKCDAVANELTAPNMFIGYRVTFCRAASVSVSSVPEP
ncbi:hypothetical protein ALC62_01030 [Cyphomyrmex costatus]|uniref:Uncharacterized protein n=1 Tax=Cyphomyrmex costatus TaxID=456900 RepID=A0A151IPP1_9HYME|nr:hypothetical protein ALC62_01030 [Cyphomyrmex costatus]